MLKVRTSLANGTSITTMLSLSAGHGARSAELPNPQVLDVSFE